MIKRSYLIHQISMKKDKPLLNIDEEKKKFDIIKNKYPFDVKYIGSSSEILQNFNLSAYTECFFFKGSLFIVTDCIQTEINKIADAVFFLFDGNISENDLNYTFNYVKSNIPEDYLKILKSKASEKKEVQHFIARDYLFKKKIIEELTESNFEYMMLKSKRIISKMKTIKMKEKDFIKYLLHKGF